MKEHTFFELEQKQEEKDRAKERRKFKNKAPSWKGINNFWEAH